LMECSDLRKQHAQSPAAWRIQGAQTQEAKKTRSKYKLEKAAGKSRYEVAPGQRLAVGLGLINT